MSPEKARGLTVDARSDIFRLGVVMYEMIAGRPPFEGETSSDLIAAILDKQPPPLARYSRNIPEAMEWIVTKALRKDREERYQNARELLTDLRGLKQRLEFQAEAERSLSPETARASAFAPVSEIKAHKRSVMVVLAALIIAIAGIVYLSTSSRPADSVAVLPFVNVSADPNTEYLSDGISESLINTLSRLPKLRVVPRSLAFRYKGRDRDPQDIGRELGVRAVLTGRVIQQGDSLNIQTELIDVSNVSQLWGEQYNRKFSNILDVQDEIARQVSGRLLIKPTGEERRGLTKRNTESIEAYQLYLKALYYYNKLTPADLRKAIEYSQQAIEKDSRYARAYATLAASYAVLSGIGGGGTVPPKELYQKSMPAVTKALELDDSLAEAHTALAWIRFQDEWEFVGAEREFKRSLQLDPDVALDHQAYAYYLLAMGRQDEAFAEIKRAEKLDPASVVVATAIAEFFFHTRQYDRSLDQCRKAIEMNPNFVRPHGFLALAYRMKGMDEEALAEYLKAYALFGGPPERLAAAKEAYMKSGWKAFWQRLLDNLKEQAKGGYVRAWPFVNFYSQVGDKDQAFEWLQKAYDDRDGGLILLKYGWPQYDNLRSDPRFDEILRKIGFP